MHVVYVHRLKESHSEWECVQERDGNVGNIIGKENISKLSKLQLARLGLAQCKHTHTRCEFFPRFSYCNKKSFEFSGATRVWNKVKLIKNDAKIVCAIESEIQIEIEIVECKMQKLYEKRNEIFEKLFTVWKRGESSRDVRDIWGDYSVGWLGLLVGWLWGHVCVTIRHYICRYIYRDSTIYSLFHCNHNQNISNLIWLGTVSVFIVYRLFLFLFCFCCKN